MPDNQIPIREQIDSTSSVVHQTFEDLEDIGETIDQSKLTLEKLAKDIRRIQVNHTHLKNVLQRTIAEEVAKQIQPLKDQLDEFLLTKPKVVYIGFKLPNPFKWFVTLFYGRRQSSK